MSVEFANAVREKYLGKFVEIYQGSSHDIRLQAEVNTDHKTILYGKVVDVIGDAVIIEARSIDKILTVMINSWSIASICESSEKISLYDMYWADIDLANQKRKKRVVG